MYESIFVKILFLHNDIVNENYAFTVFMKNYDSMLQWSTVITIKIAWDHMLTRQGGINDM